MMPWERDVYVAMLTDTLKEQRERMQHNLLKQKHR